MINRFQHRSAVCVFLFLCTVGHSAQADGGYFSRSSVAVSGDQQAIIVKTGDRITMTLRTGYTGEGSEFAWVIPTPVPPKVRDVHEASRVMQAAFGFLERATAPSVVSYGGGCFPAETVVLTPQGARPIAEVAPGSEVYSRDLSTGVWVPKRVARRLTHHYAGDIVTLKVGGATIRATGNHPFYVISGVALESRPASADVPAAERRSAGAGRWVEARSLQRGDRLQNMRGEAPVITEASSRTERMEVFNLEVEGYHNYAVGAVGLLVHNKGGSERMSKSTSSAESISGVRVYGSVSLEHYEGAILGTSSATSLLDWLEGNGYAVPTGARRVLDRYVREHWAFVAVKLKPTVMRHHRNEKLPPLTITYRSDRLVFPLLISSISTIETVGITLYVIADSTVASSTFPTRTLSYRANPGESTNWRRYVEQRIEATAGRDGRGLVVLWSGPLFSLRYGGPEEKEAFGALAKRTGGGTRYLTRLEARMPPSAMSDDIVLSFDEKPRSFEVVFYPGRVRPVSIGLKAELQSFNDGKTASPGYSASARLAATLLPFELSLAATKSIDPVTDNLLLSVEPSINLLYILCSVGPSIAWQIGPSGTEPYLGFTLRVLNLPKLPLNRSGFGLAIDVLNISVRRSPRTGQRIWTFAVGAGGVARTFMVPY